MVRRGFFAMVGLGAGVAIGIWGVRKLERAQRRLTPEHLVHSVGARADSARARWAAAVTQGRAAAAAKEAELRAVYRGGQPDGEPAAGAQGPAPRLHPD